MAAEFIKIFEENPQQKKILRIVEMLKNDGLVIYPTDTVYGLGCDIFNPHAIQKLYQLKGYNPKKTHLSFICYDLSDIAQYAKVSTPVFKVMKRALPGPFTFVLQASSRSPRIFQSSKKTVGIRVPDNNIPRQIVKELGSPIITTSIKDDDDLVEYTTDPELIYEKFRDRVDAVIDGGYGDNMPSTVVDCTNEDFVVLREGKGDITQFLV